MNDKLPKVNFRLLLRAGVPSAFVLMALVATLLWRIAVLEEASAHEDRADQAVVQAATLSADFIRMQNDQRAALLLAERDAGWSSVSAAHVRTHFAELYRLLGDTNEIVELQGIQRTYDAWLTTSERLVQQRARGGFSAVDLQLPLSSALLRKADGLVQELRGARMMASHMNENAARSAVFASIAGMVFLLIVLIVSVVWSLNESQRELQLRWELARQNEQAREIARVKSEFVTHVSHELRTPLTAIIGLAELLHDEKAGAVTQRQKRHLNDILASGEHLLNLINGVLELARAEAGRIDIHSERSDPSALAFEVLRAMEPLAQQKRIAVSLDAADAPGLVTTDPSRFRQILYNYLSNALKFTAAGGIVRVRISRESGERFRVEVSDTGPGIDPDQLQRLFVDFSQLDGHHAAARGAGLGLALTKRIVEIQGGSVGVRSTKGAGSTFFAVLPTGSAPEHSAARVAPEQRSA